MRLSESGTLGLHKHGDKRGRGRKGKRKQRNRKKGKVRKKERNERREREVLRAAQGKDTAKK